MKKWIIAIICIALVMPILLGILVSIPSAAWLKTSNDWIGFWGSYAGAIIGGLITLLVLALTLKDNQKTQEKNRRQDLCMRVSTLVSSFCIEMMAYRSKWNTLYRDSDGKEIDPIKKIEYNATMEEPRRLYFELDIILRDIPEAADLLNEVKSILDGKIPQKTIKEIEPLMDAVREKARIFIQTHSKV